MYIFFREETYARVRGQSAPASISGRTAKSNEKGRTKSGNRSAMEIMSEAVRELDSCPHVNSPKAPTVLFGPSADKLIPYVKDLEEKSKQITYKAKSGNKTQRSDTPILLGVVASYPGPSDDSDPQYVIWKKKTVDFLKSHYGEKLFSVIEHTDEANGHLHAYVSDEGRSVKTIHAGHSAQLKVKLSGGSSKEGSAAYKNAQRALLDKFQMEVGVYSGLSRIGAGKRNLTRKEWKAEKAVNRATAETLEMIESKKSSINKQVIAFNFQRSFSEKNLAKREADILKREEALNEKLREFAKYQLEIESMHRRRTLELRHALEELDSDHADDIIRRHSLHMDPYAIPNPYPKLIPKWAKNG